MSENVILAFQSIWSHKLRSFLTMLGVIIGIAAIIAIVSNIQGTNEQIKQNVVGSGGNVIEVQLQSPDYGTADFDYQTFDGVSVVEDSAIDEMNELDGVEGTACYHERYWVSNIFAGSRCLSGGNLFGVDANYLQVNGYVTSNGRNFLERDFEGNHKVAILDTKAVASLFPGENPIGKIVEIKGEPYTVVGVVDQSTASEPNISSLSDYYNYADTSAGNVFIPISTWSIIYQYDEPMSVSVKATSADDLTTAGTNVASYLNANYVSSGTYSYAAEDLSSVASELQDIANSTNNQLIWIAGIALLVGGIGVMNIMMVSVTERTREIGLKKAIGAKRRAILGQFLTEAAVLTMLGGIVGVIVGIALSKLMTLLIGTPSAISIPACIIAVVFSMVVGIVFGLLPAIKAARLNPIEALRYE